MGPTTAAHQVLALARRKRHLRARDLAPRGIHHSVLQRLVADGRLLQVGRGLYILPNSEFTSHESLALVARRSPAAVVCLLSSLSFHEVGTQSPTEVWIAVARGARQPRIDYPPVHALRFSDAAYTAGIEIHQIAGTPVRVYSVPKTIADCFKYRNKVGLDVALEALREGLRSRQASVDDIWRYAGICRVQRVIRPYLEAYIA